VTTDELARAAQPIEDIDRDPPRLVSRASYKFFQPCPMGSIKCTANATSTTMTGGTMVKASFSGNIATGNATNIPTAHRNRAIDFRRRSYRCSGFTARRLY
jgi:hypothetical protein